MHCAGQMHLLRRNISACSLQKQRDKFVLVILAFAFENQQCGFQTGLTRTGLYKHRKWSEARNFVLILERRGIALYPYSENKGADQLCSYCTADLHLCFCLSILLIRLSFYRHAFDAVNHAFSLPFN